MVGSCVLRDAAGPLLVVDVLGSVTTGDVLNYTIAALVNGSAGVTVSTHPLKIYTLYLAIDMLNNGASKAISKKN